MTLFDDTAADVVRAKERGPMLTKAEYDAAIAPARRRGPQTSKDAAKSVLGFVPQRGKQIWRMIRDAKGLTCDEIELRAEWSHQTTSARITFLRKSGYIRDSTRRRKTRTGRKAIVWVVTDQEPR
jgi:hypothetical protein